MRSGDALPIRRRHADFYWQVARDLNRWMGSVQGIVAITELSRDYADIEQALAWRVEHDLRAAADIVSSLSRFWEHGRHADGIRWSETILPRIEDRLLRARVLNTLVFLCLRVFAETDRLQSWTTEAIQLVEAGDGALAYERGVAYNNAGVLRTHKEDYSGAIALFERALPEFESAGYEPRVALTLGNLGTAYGLTENTTKAELLLRRGVALASRVGDRSAAAWIRDQLAYFLWGAGRHDAARVEIERSIQVARDFGDRISESRRLSNSAGWALDSHDLAAAKERSAEALRLAVAVDDAQSIIAAVDGFSAIAATLGQYDRAMRWRGAADRLLPQGRGVRQRRVENWLLNKLASAIACPDAENWRQGGYNAYLATILVEILDWVPQR